MERYITQQGSKLKKLTIKKEDTKDEKMLVFLVNRRKRCYVQHYFETLPNDSLVLQALDFLRCLYKT